MVEPDDTLGAWAAFWNSLDPVEQAQWGGRELSEEEKNAMRVYRNTDGTWSLVPNWFNSAEKNHKRAAATTYETFNNIPEKIQEKLSVLLLSESGSDWLTGVGKRVDDNVFWLEDG